MLLPSWIRGRACEIEGLSELVKKAVFEIGFRMVLFSRLSQPE